MMDLVLIKGSRSVITESFNEHDVIEAVYKGRVYSFSNYDFAMSFANQLSERSWHKGVLISGSNPWQVSVVQKSIALAKFEVGKWYKRKNCDEVINILIIEGKPESPNWIVFKAFGFSRENTQYVPNRINFIEVLVEWKEVS